MNEEATRKANIVAGVVMVGTGLVLVTGGAVVIGCAVAGTPILSASAAERLASTALAVTTKGIGSSLLK